MLSPRMVSLRHESRRISHINDRKHVLYINGSSMEGQDEVTVVTALSDARAPAKQQSRHKRCDASEEFERRYVLVQDENFWS